MRLALVLLMLGSTFATAVAAPIYTTTRRHKDPAVVEKEAEDTLRKAYEAASRCAEHPYLSSCPQPPNTLDKMLKELELLREER